MTTNTIIADTFVPANNISDKLPKTLEKKLYKSTKKLTQILYHIAQIIETL